MMISAVGDDRRGREILERMERWGMPTDWVTVDAERPTGTAQVDLSSGEPRFELVSPVAYDAIRPEPALGGASPSLVYFGTLAQRGKQSRSTLQRLLEVWQPEAFVDLNLRPPWTDASVIQLSCAQATWLKLSRDELAELTPASSEPDDPAAVLDAVGALFEQYQGARWVLVTLGDQGAQAVARDGTEVRAPQQPVRGDELADTVGAGDAFSAVSMLGLVEGWPMGATLTRAVSFAAAICRYRGALPDSHEVYRAYLEEWS
jgi:fructokinase